jgi:hypothetical protein
MDLATAWGRTELVALLRSYTKAEPEPEPEPEPVSSTLARSNASTPGPIEHVAPVTQGEIQPRWVEAPTCMLCASLQFSKLRKSTRKHHCRSCGWVVCAACSSHAMVLDHWLTDEQPHVLMASRSTMELRVCDRCFASKQAESATTGNVESEPVVLVNGISRRGPKVVVPNIRMPPLPSDWSKVARRPRRMEEGADYGWHHGT